MSADAGALDVERLRAAANALKTLPPESSMLTVIEVGTEFHKQLNADMALALLDRLDALETEVEKLRRVKDSAVRALGLLGEHSTDCPESRYDPLYGDIPADCECAYGPLATALAEIDTALTAPTPPAPDPGAPHP